MQSDPPAEIRCSEPAPLFAGLLRRASEQPGMALLCSALLKGAQQDMVQREAFFAAARSPALARQWLPKLIGRRWIGDIGFARAVEVARDSDPATAEALLLAAARNNPILALRSWKDYVESPYGPRILDEAVTLAPGEAIGICASPSRPGAQMREILSRSRIPWMPRLLALAGDSQIDLTTRRRIAVFVRLVDPERLPALAREATSLAGYSETLVRHAADPAVARALQEFSQMTVRDIRESGLAAFRNDLEAFSPGTLHELVTRGRDEWNEESFQGVFDRSLAPKFRKSGAIPRTHLRQFLALALRFGRSEAIDGMTPPAERARLWSGAMQGIPESSEPLAEFVTAAEIADRTSNPSYLSAMADTIEAAVRATPSHYYGLLAARLAARLPNRVGLQSAGAPYKSYFREPQFLTSDSVFPGGISVQRYFFHDDDDGVESFQRFRAGYANSGAWKLKDHDGWVQLTSVAGGRRVEIFANVPYDAVRNGSAGIADRQRLVTSELAARGWEPSVIVHRGHAYHLDKTLSYLTPAARLVYLGSCWGMESIARVMAGARSAQVIATQGTGSHTINDPLLQDLNTELLRAPVIEWQTFWAAQRAKLGANPRFRDYVPPHRNTAAILLNAYFHYLESNPETP